MTTNSSQQQVIQCDHIFLKIFSFLSIHDLSKVSICSKRMHELSTLDSMIYKRHIQSLWDTIIYNKPFSCCILERIRQLSIKELKQCLIDVDISRCIEKEDYQSMLFTHIIFHSRNYALPRNKEGKLFYPSFLCKMNKLKATYYYTLRETSRRHGIKKEELCLIHWKFTFKYHHYLPLEEEEYQEGWEVVFNDDFTVIHNLHDALMSWQVSNSLILFNIRIRIN